MTKIETNGVATYRVKGNGEDVTVRNVSHITTGEGLVILYNKDRVALCIVPVGSVLLNTSASVPANEATT